MAMQSGIGFSKIVILAGAGYTSTILLKNGKLSDLLGEIQSLVKGLEKSGNHQDGDSDCADVIAAQVRRLAAEVRQLASARQITVMNGSDGYGNVTSVMAPAAALGAFGYAYMWWKGLSFSDLMYVTKRNMANAVSNLTKHLENVSDVLVKTKKHLTQRIQNLDDKMLEQNELSRSIKEDVAGVHHSLSSIDVDLNKLHDLVFGLDGKMRSLEDKQILANHGIYYLCNFISGNKAKMPEALQEQFKLPGKSRGLLAHQETPSLMEQFKLPGKSRGLLAHQETPSLMGLKEIADSLSGGITKSAIDIVAQDGINKLEDPPRNLLRSVSTRC